MQQQWEDSYPGITGKIIKYLTLASSRSPEQGSYSGLYAACSDEVIEKQYNGVYLSDPVGIKHVLQGPADWQGKLGGESAQGQDLNLAAALWELSERMVKRIVGEDALNDWHKTAEL
jgi:hypothetical protein